MDEGHAAVFPPSIQSSADSVVYAIELSGSMFPALAVITDEVCHLLRKLTAKQKFNVIAFSETVECFSADLNGLSADSNTIEDACKWINNLQIRTTANTLAAIEHIYESSLVSEAVFVVCNYPNDPPRKVLKRLQELQTKRQIKVNCCLIENSECSEPLAKSINNLYSSLATLTDGRLTTIKVSVINMLAEELAAKIALQNEPSSDSTLVPVDTGSKKPPEVTEASESSEIAVQEDHQPATVDLNSDICGAKAAVKDITEITGMTATRDLPSEKDTATHRKASPPLPSYIDTMGQSAQEHTNDISIVYVQQPGTNLVYKGICQVVDLEKYRYATGTRLTDSIAVTFPEGCSYGHGRWVPYSKLIFESNETEPSEQLAPVLVRHEDDSTYKVGYAFKFIPNLEEEYVDVEFAGSGITSHVPYKDCTPIDDKYMDMVEMDTDIELDSNREPFDYPPIQDTVQQHHCEELMNNELHMHEDIYDTDVKELFVETDHEYSGDEANDDDCHYGDSHRRMDHNGDSNKEFTRAPRRVDSGESVHFGMPSDKELLRLEQEHERKEANVVYQHERMRLNGPAKRSAHESRENNRLAKLAAAESKQETEAARKLLAHRDRAIRSFEAEHRVSLKHEATMKAKLVRQQKFDNLAKEQDKIQESKRNENFARKQLKTTKRRAEEAARHQQQAELQDRQMERRRLTVQSRAIAEVQTRVSQDRLEDAGEEARRSACMKRMIKIETAREEQRLQKADLMTNRRKKESERRQLEAYRTMNALDERAQESIAIQARANQLEAAKREAAEQAELEAERTSNRHVQAHLARRQAEEERQMLAIEKQERIVEVQREKTRMRDARLASKRIEHEAVQAAKQESALKEQLKRSQMAHNWNEKALRKETKSFENRRAHQPVSYARIHDRVNDDYESQQAMKLNGQRRQKAVQRETKEIDLIKESIRIKNSLAETNARTLGTILLS